MSKRKRQDEHEKSSSHAVTTDIARIAGAFDTFVMSLAKLISVTPEENFSTRNLESAIEDRAVIAKVLKRMRGKGQLSWMDQYLKEEDFVSPSTEIDPSEDDQSFPTDKKEKKEKTTEHKEVPGAAAIVAGLADITATRRNEQTAGTSEWPPALPAIKDQVLLKQAFTHRSYATALAPAQSTKDYLTSLHNERLEFLGDSFLNHSVTKMLFARMPDSREGELSLLRAELIGNTTAATFGRSYGFDTMLLLNDTAERDGVRKTPKVIADTFEAYLGALILDGKDGVLRADDWLKALMNPRIEEYLETKVDEPVNPYAKQKIWNHFVRQYPPISTSEDGTPRAAISIKYEWVDGGGGNEGGFIIAAKLTVPNQNIWGQELGRGFGLNKKEAEHRAAMHAVSLLNL